MPSTTLAGTSGSGSGPEVVARISRPFWRARRLKYSAAIRLLADPCRHTKATFCVVMLPPVVCCSCKADTAAGLPFPRELVGACRGGDILKTDAGTIEDRD